jgi:hypothetical protein
MQKHVAHTRFYPNLQSIKYQIILYKVSDVIWISEEKKLTLIVLFNKIKKNRYYLLKFMKNNRSHF